MPPTPPPAGRAEEDALMVCLGDILDELRELETALPQINDQGLHSRVEHLVALVPGLKEAHGKAPGQDIAEALTGLRDAVRALHVPARDLELGATLTLRRLREAKGLINASIDDALTAAAVLGFQPAHPPPPHEQSLELRRDIHATEVEILTARLAKVEQTLDLLDTARKEPASFVQQTGLLNVYVPTMRVEVNLARLHLTIGEDTIDLGALARAVEAMGNLTGGFVATMRAWAADVADSVARGANAVRDSVRRLVAGVRTVVGMVLRDRNDKETFPFPVPDMVLIPPGSFMMGVPAKESQKEKTKDDNARPVHRVTIARPFWLGRYPVTRGEYAAFVEDEGYDKDGGAWRDAGFPQTDRDPVVKVSAEDADAYAAWLSRKTRHAYRLPSEAEWEYAARAGTTTARYWEETGEDAARHARFGGDTHGTAPVDGRKPNAFGLHDVLGNVWEWTADPWHDDYKGAPADGSVWTTGGRAASRVLRGGSRDLNPRFVRAGYRYRGVVGGRSGNVGFRLARTSF